MEPAAATADVAKLKQDARDGRIKAEHLVDLLVSTQRQLQVAQQQLQVAQQQLQVAQQQLQAASQRIAELEKQVGGSATAKVEQPYSLREEEKRQEERGKKKKGQRPPQGRRGRLSSAEKVKRAERTTPVFPEGVPPSDCQLSHTRPVWRLENGRAVLIAYAIYRGPGNEYGKIPGVLGRSEFGLEIVIEIAHLVYVVGLSFDKVCALLSFFQNLKLGKSQVDALLHRLARHWEHEFEVLCTLLANAAVVHADETGWSLNSVWAFLSEQARLLFFGVPKDAATLKVILDPETFAGLLNSDDAAVYANFSCAQKCWAHLLRKAIKLTLQAPDQVTYRDFADGLLEIYRWACRVQSDGRLSAAGRERKVAALSEAILELCGPDWRPELAPLEGLDNDYRLLVNEVMRLLLAEELFTFVTAPPVTQPNGETKPVAGTNNESERTLRGPAGARDTGRTNKNLVGARRQTILTSVLESLRVYLPKFTLTSVLAEIQRWVKQGHSCFTKRLRKLKLRTPESSVLDRVLPHPSG